METLRWLKEKNKKYAVGFTDGECNAGTVSFWDWMLCIFCLSAWRGDRGWKQKSDGSNFGRAANNGDGVCTFASVVSVSSWDCKDCRIYLFRAGENFRILVGELSRNG